MGPEGLPSGPQKQPGRARHELLEGARGLAPAAHVRLASEAKEERVRSRGSIRCVLSIICVIGVAVLVTAGASGSVRRSLVPCSSKQPAKVELACGRSAYYHQLGVATSLRRAIYRVKVRHVARSSWVPVSDVIVRFYWGRGAQKEPLLYARLRLRLRLVRVARSRIVEAQHRLVPPRPIIAHEQLWQCVHEHEAGSWSDHDSGGNGHYGGMQMSWDWLGLVNGDAGNLSEYEQMRVAETAYARSGYSSSFLDGQWFDYDHGYSCLAYA